MIFVAENLQAKVTQKLFGQVWGSTEINPSQAQNLPVPTPMSGRVLITQGMRDSCFAVFLAYLLVFVLAFFSPSCESDGWVK